MIMWFRAFHIIAMVAWFAGLFYLPRLFVYHADASDSISLERFKVMERRLCFGIMTPAAIVTIIFGLGLFHLNPAYYAHALWMKIKLSLVAVLLVYHGLCIYYVRQFKLDNNQHSSKFYRYFNEFPTLILIAVVILVCVQRPV